MSNCYREKRRKGHEKSWDQITNAWVVERMKRLLNVIVSGLPAGFVGARIVGWMKSGTITVLTVVMTAIRTLMIGNASVYKLMADNWQDKSRA